MESTSTFDVLRLSGCFSLLSIVVMKEKKKKGLKHLGGKGLFGLQDIHHPSCGEVKSGTQQQNLMQRPWRNTACLV